MAILNFEKKSNDIDEKIRRKTWDRFINSKSKKCKKAIRKGQLDTYDDQLIEALRDYKIMGIPSSLPLLCLTLKYPEIFDKAEVLTYVLSRFPDIKEVNMIVADCNSNILHPDHDLKVPYQGSLIYVEAEFQDGSIKDYVPKEGIVYDASVLYDIENPEIIYNIPLESVKASLAAKNNISPEEKKSNLEYVLRWVKTIVEHADNFPEEIYTIRGCEKLQIEYDVINKVELDPNYRNKKPTK